jgi:hypothetical protein
MSYSACSNSALLAPDAYPVGAIGSTFTPAINLNPVASNTLLQPIAQFTLPKGRWLVSGLLKIDGTVGTETLVGNAAIAVDAVVLFRWSVLTPEPDGVSVPLSAVLESDGTALITLPTTFTTSGGGTYGCLAAPLTNIQFTRIA